jgi:hypothetical protein
MDPPQHDADLGDQQLLQPEQQQPAFAQPAPAQPANMGNFSLQPFWSTNPEAWFSLTEGQFYLRGITDARAQFYLACNAIPETQFRTLGDLLRGPPPPDAYNIRKHRLLAAHTLTDYQRMEQLTQHRPIPGQRPSEVLAELTQFCPLGESNTKIFRLLYLSRLPRELRIILSEDTDSPLTALAARADQLWSHTPQHGSGVAAVSSSDTDGEVAAIGRGRNRGAKRGNNKPRGGGGGGRGRGSHQDADSARQEQLASGLCWAHWRFGEEAYTCKAPCSWAEN